LGVPPVVDWISELIQPGRWGVIVEDRMEQSRLIVQAGTGRATERVEVADAAAVHDPVA